MDKMLPVTEMLETESINRMKQSVIDLHSQIIINMKETVGLGLKAGELLLAIKNELPHGAFTRYVEENFSFNIRTAQKYMKIASNPEKLEESGAKMLSEAYDSVQTKKDPVEEVEVDFGDDDYEDEEELDDFTPPPEPIEIQSSGNGEEFWYWQTVSNLIDSMKITHKRLAAKRNSTTPRALGMFIGNILDMANRLDLWDPDKLTVCPECKGKCVLPYEDKITGEITNVECPNCINGYVGPFAQSKN